MSPDLVSQVLISAGNEEDHNNETAAIDIGKLQDESPGLVFSILSTPDHTYTGYNLRLGRAKSLESNGVTAGTRRFVRGARTS